MRRRITPADFLRKNWLLVGILLCILLAGLAPNLGSKNGPLKTEYTVKFGAVFLIFLISGLNIKTDSIFATFRQYKLHLYIQCFTFVLIPLLVQIFIKFLNVFGINAWVLKGLLTVACMPPPVSSAVILTRAAQGNETASILNSVLGSFLGILLTPLHLLNLLGSTTIIPVGATIFQLTTTVLLPLSLGQLFIRTIDIKSHKLAPLNTVSQMALLFVIYTTFCDTFTTPEAGLTALDIIVTILSVLLLQIFLMALSFKLADFCQFTVQDKVAVVFCATHKSLTLGIPILRIMFHGYAHLSQISLPLLVYHPMQIILGGLLVPHLKQMVYRSLKIKATV